MNAAKKEASVPYKVRGVTLVEDDEEDGNERRVTTAPSSSP